MWQKARFVFAMPGEEHLIGKELWVQGRPEAPGLVMKIDLETGLENNFTNRWDDKQAFRTNVFSPNGLQLMVVQSALELLPEFEEDVSRVDLSDWLKRTT